jgi:hypothetical protein
LHQPIEIVLGQSQSQLVQWDHGKQHVKPVNAPTGLWFSMALGPTQRDLRYEAKRASLCSGRGPAALPPGSDGICAMQHILDRTSHAKQTGIKGPRQAATVHPTRIISERAQPRERLMELSWFGAACRSY